MSACINFESGLLVVYVSLHSKSISIPPTTFTPAFRKPLVMPPPEQKKSTALNFLFVFDFLPFINGCEFMIFTLKFIRNRNKALAKSGSFCFASVVGRVLRQNKMCHLCGCHRNHFFLCVGGVLIFLKRLPVG